LSGISVFYKDDKGLLPKGRDEADLPHVIAWRRLARRASG
jgi:hypothetical protein